MPKDFKFRPRETSYREPDYAEERLKRRMAILGAIAFVAFGVLFARLWVLQIVSGDRYKEKAEGNRIREIIVEAPRGKILDRNGKVLVKNRSALTVSVIPVEMRDEDEVITRLSKVIGMGEKEIREKIKSGEAYYHRAVLLASDVSPEVITYIKEHKDEFPGVVADTRPVREYPHGELASHVIGYLGEISPEQLENKEEFEGCQAGDDVGESGLECYYEKWLRGESGNHRIEIDAMGNPIRVLSKEEPKSGNDLYTTLDLDVQRLVEDALANQVEVARGTRDAESGKSLVADGASAIVLDPRNGEVVAMASYPPYELDKFVGGISEKEWKKLNDPESFFPLNNRAIMSQVPPGSTFKVVTAAAGMNEGCYTQNSPFVCNHVYKKGAFEDFPKYCWSNHGKINLFTGIVESCDVVFYEIGYTLYQRQQNNEGKPLEEYARMFGLGRRTGIDLVSEMEGRVPSPEWKREYNEGEPELQVWYPGDTVNMAIGQGDVLTTPLQMTRLFAAIANGGELIQPHLMKSLTKPDGETLLRGEKEVTGHLDIEPSILQTLSESLKGVVKGDGTASATFKGFPLDEIAVAGKTGTAEIIGKQPYAWFVSYAPAGDPRYVVCVMIEEGGHGGQTAAPVVRRILEGLFNLEESKSIPPSEGD